jgi:hypothetical protein
MPVRLPRTTQGYGSYDPPNTGQVIGGALGGMADALMRISSMQSDRIDRAYTLARQNRLDQQAVRRIELDSIRLTNEAQRNEALLAQQDLARDKYDTGREDYATAQTQEAAGSWYDMYDSGVRIRAHEMTGAPMSTAEDIIQRIQEGQPIRHLTEHDPTRSQSFQTAMATDTATASADQERDQALIAQGINPRTRMPLTPQESANIAGMDYSEGLGARFARTPQGRQERLGLEARQTQSIAAAGERAEADPYALLSPEQQVQEDQVYVADQLGNEYWLDNRGLQWQEDLTVLWGRDQMEAGVEPPPGAYPMSMGGPSNQMNGSPDDPLSAAFGATSARPAAPAPIDQPPDPALGPLGAAFDTASTMTSDLQPPPLGATGQAPIQGGGPQDDRGIVGRTSDSLRGALSAGSGEYFSPDGVARAERALQEADSLLARRAEVQAGAPTESTWAIDRIEGGIAVLIADDGSGTTEVPLDSLPPGSREGSVLRDTGGGWVLDEEARAERLRQGGAAMGGLRTRDPGGDLTLGAL